MDEQEDAEPIEDIPSVVQAWVLQLSEPDFLIALQPVANERLDIYLRAINGVPDSLSLVVNKHTGGPIH